MDSDDAAYHRSVRNMVVVLAVLLITIVAALALPPVLFPYRQAFQSSVSLGSPYGFTLNLSINATSTAGEGVMITGWLNSSSSSLQNVTASDSWGVGPVGLSSGVCDAGWPVAFGVMKGHYDQDNFTLGTLLALPATTCAPQAGTPGYFLLPAHSSRALVSVNGVPEYWVLQSGVTFGYATGEGLAPGAAPGRLPPGVYTVVMADEWGDVLTTNFSVS